MGVLDAGDEPPPAVVSLLAGRLDQDGFAATLLDLAARGWFRFDPASQPGTLAPPMAAGPVMCILPGQPPAQRLAPYEQRVAAHVALRAGVRGQVPAPALRDGFHSGETEFMKGFREEVAADARQRGLTRWRLSGRRIAQLCALMLIPAGVLLFALLPDRHAGALGVAAVAYLVLAGVCVGFGTRERPTEAGRAVLGRWRAACAAGPGGARLEAYAAVLGLAPGPAAVFARPGKNMAWSSYRGSWQLIAIETGVGQWSCGTGILVLLAAIGVPILYISAVIWLFTNGMAALAERALLLIPATAAAGFAVWLARRAAGPQFAEFNGQVIRQWVIKGGDESPDEYHVAVDDGVRDRAWDLDVGSESYRRLPPGTFVHARVNLRHRDQVRVDPVEPPPRRWLPDAVNRPGAAAMSIAGGTAAVLAGP